jgi:hypothetical protein
MVMDITLYSRATVDNILSSSLPAVLQVFTQSERRIQSADQNNGTYGRRTKKLKEYIRQLQSNAPYLNGPDKLTFLIINYPNKTSTTNNICIVFRPTNYN